MIVGTKKLKARSFRPVEVREKGKMAKRKGPSTSGPRTRSKAVKDRQVESIQRLDKLPKEVWEMILDHLENDDLFPLALSCRFFRQKQKELVARATEQGSECECECESEDDGVSRRALKTTLRYPVEGQRASAEYLRFLSKENEGAPWTKDMYVRRLAAFHGHLPLLQEFLKSSETRKRKEKLAYRTKPWDFSEIASHAGESSSSQSPLLLCVGF